MALVAPRYQRFRWAGGALLLVWTGDRNCSSCPGWCSAAQSCSYWSRGYLVVAEAPTKTGLATALWLLAAMVVFVVAIYGGYFGAGIGILMISALSLLRMGDVHRVVPFKNLLAGCLRTVAVIVLVIYGEIAWRYGIPMAVGGLIGGYLGTLTRRVNRTVLRGRRYDRVRAGGVLLLDHLRHGGQHFGGE